MVVTCILSLTGDREEQPSVSGETLVGVGITALVNRGLLEGPAGKLPFAYLTKIRRLSSRFCALPLCRICLSVGHVFSGVGFDAREGSQGLMDGGKHFAIQPRLQPRAVFRVF